MLHDMACETNAGIIMLTESHLNQEIKDAEIKIDGDTMTMLQFCNVFISNGKTFSTLIKDFLLLNPRQ